MGLFNKALFRYLSTTKELGKYFSPEQRKKFIGEYLGSINLSKGLSDTEGFNKFQQDRIRQATDLLDFKEAPPKTDKDSKDKPEPKPLLKGNWEKLKEDTPEARAVNDKIKTALQDTPALTAAVARYNQDLELINAELQKVPSGIKPESVIGILHAAKADAIKAIKEHQEQAKQAIEDLFEDDTFKRELSTSMGLADPTQLEKAKQEMLNTLEKANKADLKKFEDSCGESIKDMHNIIQRERDRIAYIAAMRTLKGKEFDKFQEAINRLAEANRTTPAGPAQISTTNPKEGEFSLRGVDIKDLDILQTITGRPIAKNADGSMSVTLPRWSIDPYYNSRHQNVDYDFQSLAEAVRACGHDSVTIDITEGNEKDADEYARRMYEACINAGFPPENIKVNVNGVERKLTDTIKDGNEKVHGLFAGLPERYAKTQQTAKALKEDREKMLAEPTSAADIAKYKSQLQTLRNPPPAPAPDDPGAVPVI